MPFWTDLKSSVKSLANGDLQSASNILLGGPPNRSPLNLRSQIPSSFGGLLLHRVAQPSSNVVSRAPIAQPWAAQQPNVNFFQPVVQTPLPPQHQQYQHYPQLQAHHYQPPVLFRTANQLAPIRQGSLPVMPYSAQLFQQTTRSNTVPVPQRLYQQEELQEQQHQLQPQAEYIQKRLALHSPATAQSEYVNFQTLYPEPNVLTSPYTWVDPEEKFRAVDPQPGDVDHYDFVSDDINHIPLIEDNNDELYEKSDKTLNDSKSNASINNNIPKENHNELKDDDEKEELQMLYVKQDTSSNYI